MDGIAIVVGDTPGDPLQVVIAVENALAINVIVIATSVPALLILPVLLVVPDLALVLSRNSRIMPDDGLNGTAGSVIGLTTQGLVTAVDYLGLPRSRGLSSIILGQLIEFNDLDQLVPIIRITSIDTRQGLGFFLVSASLNGFLVGDITSVRS